MQAEIAFLRGLQFLVESSPWMFAVVVFCARWCIFLNLLPAYVLFFHADPRKRHAVYEALWSVLCALAITTMIALWIQRDRPFISEDVALLIPPPFTTAFPSAHTAASVAIACALLFASRTAGVFSCAVAAFVIFGRMAAGVHFPTDILGGICVGVLSFGLVRMAHRALRRRLT